MNALNRLFAAGLLVLSVYICISAVDLGITDGRNPGAGFMPLLTGSALGLLGLLIGIRTFGAKVDKRPNPFSKEELYNAAVITGSSVAAVLLIPVLGIVASLGVMSGGLAFFMGERRIHMLAGLAVGTPVVLYLIFGLGLGMPLPMGLFKS